MTSKTSPRRSRSDSLALTGAVARSLALHAARNGCAAARPLPPLVRRARLVAARASIGAAGKGPRRPFGATDRADRRRQDAGRISADAGGASSAVLKGAGEKSLVSTGRTVKRTGGLHTLYISPLKALAVDIARNLETPIAEMGLPIKVETRTGDTPVSRRQRQRRYPPDILLTTPEQLALLLSSDDAPFLFSLAEAHRARRAACARHLQARRSAVAWPGAAVAARARNARDRPVRDRGRAGIAGAVPGAAA